jgi:hypothetical protein
MPKISGAEIIENTTWLKLQIGDIELTSVLPSINAQNISRISHEISLKYPTEYMIKYLKMFYKVLKIFSGTKTL